MQVVVVGHDVLPLDDFAVLRTRVGAADHRAVVALIDPDVLSGRFGYVRLAACPAVTGCADPAFEVLRVNGLKQLDLLLEQLAQFDI